MKRILYLWLFLLFAALTGHASAAGNGLFVRVSAPDRANRFEVVIENGSNETQRVSVAIELKHERWVEYPQRIEDSRPTMQRPIHVLASTAKKTFVWNIARDRTLAPELPAGVPPHEATPVTARIRVSILGGRGVARTFVYSKPFSARI